jgi:hypothetical protein
MRRIAATILFLLPLLGPAAEPGNFATLSPKEIADGWILLFDGKTTFGWTSPTGTKWTILDGMLAPQGDEPALLVTKIAFADYDVSLEYRQKTQKSLRLIVPADAEGKETAGKPAMILKGGDGWWKGTLRIQGGSIVSGSFESVGSSEGFKKGGIGGSSRTGHIALAGKGFIVRNVKLRPLNTKPLFNGKDLSGWKKYEGDKKQAKSTFSVVKEGWLSLKNGPGDLQTEGQWDDFVLQLDCRTNGKNLNSGVFFRCLPGQYQMGYEAQIHNKFLEPPGREYTLDVYDPETHKLKAKKKEHFLAADYGTGAIYRRMPARLQMAKDKEWFTMTVVAHGRHLATWVNGLQVVDWTDNRPLADNAREGCYLKKGPISLQGHDPTTDLNFRNLRLAELPPPAAKK